jgi:hypothetical protein
MFEFLTHIATIFGILAGVWMGYKAGKKEDRIFTERIPNLEIIETDKEPEALEDDDKIREDMKKTRTISGGYDFDEN